MTAIDGSARHAEVLATDASLLRHAAATRAAGAPLPQPDVQRVMTALVDTGDFDALLAGTPADPLREQLVAAATRVLVEEGRDPGSADAIAHYVRSDLWARFPEMSGDYAALVSTLHERWGFFRIESRQSASRREALIAWERGSGELYGDESLTLPYELGFEIFEGHVMIAITRYLKRAQPATVFHRPGWVTRWAAVQDLDELVQLDAGALQPTYVSPEVIADVHVAAIAYREWQSARRSAVYQVQQRRSHGEVPDFP